MSRALKWFWVVVAAQALFLLAWAGYHEAVRQHAPVILLKGRPVDPQDLVRGDYMTLTYDISQVKFPGLPKDKPAIGTILWVLLEQKDHYYAVAQVSRERLTPGPSQILVSGTVVHNWRDTDLRVDYGIERYFVPEGKGSPRFTLLEVEASVSPSHRLYIRRVLLDGQAYP